MLTPVSIIVPTYKEVQNLPLLIESIERLMTQHPLQVELLIMDDDSCDGTEQLIQRLKKSWVKLVTRKQNRGLSTAVMDGLVLAKHDYIVVMDADLSHPPSAIPELLHALKKGAHDFAIGSRYVKGGKTDDNWGFFRWLNSRGATLLAYPLTRVKDPMSGFFALKKETLQKAKYLNPVGYKIGLELLVKCDCKNPAEIPIHFTDRQYGESKLSMKQQLLYLKHLRRLFIYKYAEQSHIIQYLLVGLSGTIINLAIMTAMLWLGSGSEVAVATGILISLTTNFLLNRQLTFSYARHRSFWKQLTGFVSACAVGGAINFFTAVGLIETVPLFRGYPQLAALVGITVGTAFNYCISRYLVFNKRSSD